MIKMMILMNILEMNSYLNKSRLRLRMNQTNLRLKKVTFKQKIMKKMRRLCPEGENIEDSSKKMIFLIVNLKTFSSHTKKDL
jgi:hypothetical protein